MHKIIKWAKLETRNAKFKSNNYTLIWISIKKPAYFIISESN